MTRQPTRQAAHRSPRMNQQTSIASVNRTPLEGVNVLFVDNSPDERALFSMRFGRDCATLATASSIEEALATLERGETELLVTEIHLAGHDGFELVRRMRDLPATQAGAVPAIAASAWIGLRDRIAEIPSGFSGCIVKPYDEEELLAVVADLSTAIAALRRLRRRGITARVDGRELRP